MKSAKKDKKELDEDEIAFKEKQKAGMSRYHYQSLLLSWILADGFLIISDAKAKKELMEAAKGKKGPLNTGNQGIKKSGKK